MKKILYFISAFVINVHGVYASDWVICLYSEAVTLYKTGMERHKKITTSRFVVARAPSPKAVIASYDLLFNQRERTVKVMRVGDRHEKEERYVGMIKKWFDNAPDSWKIMQWVGLEPSAEVRVESNAPKVD